MSDFPQWCLVCAAQAWNNSCGHFPGHPIPPRPKLTEERAA